MNERKKCQYAYFPALVFSLYLEAIKKAKDDEEKEVIDNHAKIAAIVYNSYVDNAKLARRVSRAVHATILLFVDSRDNSFHIRKIILALHNAAQIAFDEQLIDKDIALVVQDALDLESSAPMDDEAWLKLKASADKKVIEIIEILKKI